MNLLDAFHQDKLRKNKKFKCINSETIKVLASNMEPLISVQSQKDLILDDSIALFHIND